MNTDIIAHSPLFKGVSVTELEELLRQVLYKLKNYSAGQMIAQSGEECKSLQIVLSGSVKGEMVDFSGKTIKIEDVVSPRSLAVAFLFGKNNYYPVNIVANADVEIFSLPKTSVVKLLQLNEAFLTNYMNTISSKAQFLSDKIRFLSFHSLRGKLVHYILQLSRGLDGEVILPNSQDELASMFGVARPSVGRMLRELHNEGYIEAKGKSVRIIDRQGLLNLLKKE
ncbi:Crp/Fnr family transcriptional regulator [Marinilabiliaceae bacterium JC017]|nr:Crp/Fnr family transcriptional regulator [Marinilabiliaceae bacterium JC017]